MPVLFITAATAARRAEAREAGGNGFVQKPFDLDELLEVIARLLDGGREWRSGTDRRQRQQPYLWPDRRRGERRRDSSRPAGSQAAAAGSRPAAVSGPPAAEPPAGGEDAAARSRRR